MILLPLYDFCLSHIVPSVTIGMLVSLVQMWIGAYLTIQTLIRVVRRRSVMQTILCCFVPIVIIVTNATAEPFLFGAFLGDGFLRENAEYVQRVLIQYQQSFFVDVAVVSILFLVCSVFFIKLERRSGGGSPLRIALNMGVEYAVLIVNIVFCVDCFAGTGELFGRLPLTLMKWYIYSTYLLLSKCIFWVTCFLFSLLFRQWRGTLSYENGADVERWLRWYISDHYRMLGLSAIFFFGFWVFLLFDTIQEEGITFSVGVMMFFPTIVLAAGVWFIFLALFPRFSRIYRSMSDWGIPERIMWLLYREMMERKPVIKLPMGWGIVTEHFVILNVPYRIFYLPLYERAEAAGESSWRFYFKDGSRFKINDVGAKEIAWYIQKLRNA